jgi:hypothetical protein
MAKDATKLRLGPANVHIGTLGIATMSTTLTGTNNDLKYTAQPAYAGTLGNAITVAYIAGVPSQTLAVTVNGTAITVLLGTDGSSVITSTADAVRNAIRDSSSASSLVKVTRKAGDDGSGLVTVLAATALTGGSNTVVMEDAGYLGDGLVVTPSVETAPLTALQLGNLPVNEIVLGGGFRFTIPFKQIQFEVFEKAFPGAILQEDGAGKRRLEFTVVVGQNQLELARRIEIRRLTGVGETTNKEDILVIPLGSPVAGESNLPYGNEQQVITANFRAWPDARGRVAYFGEPDI